MKRHLPSSVVEGNRQAGTRSQLISRLLFVGPVVVLLACLVWLCVPENTVWKWRLAWRSWWRGGTHDVRLYEWGGVERSVQVSDPDRYACGADHDFALAVLLFEDGQYNAASQLAWELDGTLRDADGGELLGVIYVRQEMHTAAAELLRRLQAEYPGQATIRQTLIWVLAQDRRTLDEAQALAWQAASGQSDWSAPHMLRGIHRRQFWWLLRRVLMLCAGSTMLLAMGGAMVRMLCERPPQDTRSASTTEAPTMNHTSAASAPPRQQPRDQRGINVETVVWHAVNLLRLAKGKVTEDSVAMVINSSPRSKAEYFDVRWRTWSPCFKCFRTIEQTGTSDARHRETFGFWRREFKSLRAKSRAKLIETVLEALEQVGVEAIYHQQAKRWRQKKRKVQA